MSTTTGAAPTRIAGIDIARGLALLGMVVVHVAIGDPESEGFGRELLEAPRGRAAVLFFMLAGVALSVIARRGARSADTDVLLRRGAVLLVVGLVVREHMWGGSILHAYGAMFLLAPLLLGRRTRTLLIGAAACFIVAPWAIQTFGADFYTWARTDSQGVHGYLLEVLGLTLFGQYALVGWAGFFMVGLVVGRLDLRSSPTTLAMLVGGAMGAVLLTLGTDEVNWRLQQAAEADYAAAEQTCVDAMHASGLFHEQYGPSDLSESLRDAVDNLSDDALADYLSALPEECGALMPDGGVQAIWFTTLEPHSESTAWALQALLIAIGVLGLCLLLPTAVQRVLWPVQALGSIALTGYLVHLPLIQDVWWWAGNDRDRNVQTMSTGAQVALLMGIMVFLLVMAVVIRRFFPRGPFEWALSQLAKPELRRPR